MNDLYLSVLEKTVNHQFSSNYSGVNRLRQDIVTGWIWLNLHPFDLTLNGNIFSVTKRC